MAGNQRWELPLHRGRFWARGDSKGGTARSPLRKLAIARRTRLAAAIERAGNDWEEDSAPWAMKISTISLRYCKLASVLKVGGMVARLVVFARRTMWFAWTITMVLAVLFRRVRELNCNAERAPIPLAGERKKVPGGHLWFDNCAFVTAGHTPKTLLRNVSKLIIEDR